MDTKKLLAELIGTFVFFLIGLMAIISTKAMGGPDLVVIGFGFGLGLFVAIQAFGHVSGGHFNPAVTVAAVLDGRLDPMTGVGYVVSQLIGGIAAATVVLVLTSQAAVAGTATVPGEGISDLQALAIETVFSAIFIVVILNSTKRAPAAAPFTIPVTLLVIHFAIVPFTGSSVNPARSIASAVVGARLDSLWVYLVAPIIGAVIGFLVHRYVIGETEPA